MKRIKTFTKYLIWFIIFYMFSDLMINIGLNTIYKNIEAKYNLPQVNITEADSTHVNGRIRGDIDLEKNSDLIGKYLKVNLYSKRDVLLGTDYIKIEKNGDNSIQTIEEHFKYNDVTSYDLSIIDENQKIMEVEETTDKSLFSGFRNSDLSIGEILWISIIAVAFIF